MKRIIAIAISLVVDKQLTKTNTQRIRIEKKVKNKGSRNPRIYGSLFTFLFTGKVFITPVQSLPL